MIEQTATPSDGRIERRRARAKCRILLVDDSVEVLDALAEVLTVAGYEVVTATDGVTAIALALQELPNLVLIDLRLPQLSGWEVARRLRARFGDRIVLAALTGWSAPGDRARSRAAGFDHHLTKPASLRELRALALEALERS
jgi:CheY-like chemotaxis protein